MFSSASMAVIRVIQGCLSLTVTGRPILRLGAPAVQGRRLIFPVGLSPVLLGRRAILTQPPC